MIKAEQGRKAEPGGRRKSRITATRIPQEWLNRWHEKCREDQKTMSEVLRSAIHRYIFDGIR